MRLEITGRLCREFRFFREKRILPTCPVVWSQHFRLGESSGVLDSPVTDEKELAFRPCRLEVTIWAVVQIAPKDPRATHKFTASSLTFLRASGAMSTHYFPT